MKNITEKLHEKLTFEKVTFYIFLAGKHFFTERKLYFHLKIKATSYSKR